MRIINLKSELHIDEDANAAYLYLDKQKENKAHYTNYLLDDKGWNINIDYNNDWKVIWIEFLPASNFFNE